MALLESGNPAPTFSLQTDEGATVAIDAKAGQPIVLFFYPKDDTPGCTIECKEFRDARPAFEAKARVFGISPDDVASHQAFRDKFGLNFPLLSDPGHKIADVFGVWGPRKNGSEGILRTTFVLHQGKVARVFTDVKPEGHAQEVLAVVSSL
jgi:peroxiredoxin Q/BCP